MEIKKDPRYRLSILFEGKRQSQVYSLDNIAIFVMILTGNATQCNILMHSELTDWKMH